MIEPTDAALNFALRRSIAENRKRIAEEEEHERKIAAALERWHAATKPTEARKAYTEFRRLVALRSPRMVAKIERDRGLRQ